MALSYDAVAASCGNAFGSQAPEVAADGQAPAIAEQRGVAGEQPQPYFFLSLLINGTLFH